MTGWYISVRKIIYIKNFYIAILLFIYRITRNSVSEIVICWSLVFNFQHKTANTITNIFAGSIMQWNLNAIKERGFVSIVFKRFIDSVFSESLSSKTKWNQGWVLLLFVLNVQYAKKVYSFLCDVVWMFL